MSHHHEQVTIDTGLARFECDRGIAPLVVALWRAGYRTTGSCEHQAGTSVAWIAFPSRRWAEKFAKLCGGRVIEPTAEELADARRRGDALLGSTGVAFPCDRISDVVEAVQAERSGDTPGTPNIRR
jgi:hypothetical protein